MWQDLLSLDTLANPDAPVFRSRTGKALDRSRVLHIVQEAAKRAGLREVSARTGCDTRTQRTAWSVARRFIWCRLPWRNGGWRQLPETKLYGEYGLVNLIQLIPSLASRKKESS